MSLPPRLLACSKRKATRATVRPQQNLRKTKRLRLQRSKPRPQQNQPQEEQRQRKQPPVNEKFRDAAIGRASNQKQRPVPRLRDVILRKLPKAAHERKIKWRIQIQSWSNSAA